MKRQILRWGLAVLLGLVICGGVLYAGFYFTIIKPNEELSDAILSKTPVDKARMRDICHRVISMPWGNAHDAFLELARCGDTSSIPYLIRSLRWQQGPSPRGGFDCQTVHCLHALHVLTGQDFGYEPARWEKWWKENRNNFTPPPAPPSHNKAARANQTKGKN